MKLTRSVGQLPLNNSSFNQRPAEDGPLADLVRLVRRVCLLRAHGDLAGAARLRETDLASAVRDVRLARGPEALTESGLQAMFSAEEDRVAEAAVLVDLLVPHLVEALSAGPAVPRGVRAEPVARSGAARAPAAGGSPAIPDLLDAMLAADRNSRRLLATVKPES